MADTVFLTNDALTRKKWARELFSIVLPATEINSLVGKGPDSIIQMRTELGKGEGDELTFGIRLPLEGEGIVGRDTVEGSEEELVFKDFKATIEELNHAVATGGRMEQQRVPYNLMQEGKDGLQYWWGEKLSDMAFAHLGGDTTYKVAGVTFAQDPVDPDDEHWLKVNDVAEASMTSADLIDLTFLDRMKQQAEVPDLSKNCYKVRPLVIKGKKYYRAILHNYVFDRLRQNTNVGQWGDLQRAANKLTLPDVEIEYNGLLVGKSERVRQMVVDTTDAKAGVFRNLLLGCQAAVMAWGGAGESKSTTMAFVPYETDAKRFVNIRGGGIFGIKTVRFQSRDFGRIVGSSWGAPIT
jgi:N4-gp56 family major capsid protein